MNRTCFFLITVLLFSSWAPIQPLTQLTKDEAREWTLRKEKDGIRVFTRPPLSGNLKDAKAECLVENCSMSEILELAKDHERYTQWMYRVTKTELVKQVNETEFYIYAVFDTPWPFLDRDAVVHVKAEKMSGEYVSLVISLAPEFYEESEDMISISKLIAYWQIEKRDNDLFVSYEAAAAPGGWIPDWIANLAATDLPFESLRLMKEELK